MTLRILVVDDNRDIVLTAGMLLRAQGHHTNECYDGSEVMRCVEEYDPDVVLLDIGLPGKSGWDVAKEIRQRIPGKRPLLVGMSGGETRPADRLLATASGFDYFLIKPVDPKVLLALLSKG